MFPCEKTMQLVIQETALLFAYHHGDASSQFTREDWH